MSSQDGCARLDVPALGRAAMPDGGTDYGCSDGRRASPGVITTRGGAGRPFSRVLAIEG